MLSRFLASCERVVDKLTDGLVEWTSDVDADDDVDCVDDVCSVEDVVPTVVFICTVVLRTGSVYVTVTLLVSSKVVFESCVRVVVSCDKAALVVESVWTVVSISIVVVFEDWVELYACVVE